VTRLARALGVLVVLASLLPTAVLADGGGIIGGQVVNGTSGGNPVGETPVVLRTYRGPQEDDPIVSGTDAEGYYRFEDLDAGGGVTYAVQVSYDGVVYSSDAVTFEPGQSAAAANVMVYETTTDDAAIAVERAHLIVTVLATGLSVTEFHVLANSADRTYVGRDAEQGEGVTSEFILPEGGRDLGFEGGSLGGRFRSVKGGFADTEPLRPGRSSVAFRYSLDSEDGECFLVRSLSRRTSAVNLLVPDSGVRVETEDLAFDGRMETEGGGYLNFAGGVFLTGDTIAVRIVLPQPTAEGWASPWIVPTIVLGTLLAAGALAYPFWRRARRGAVYGGEGEAS
jgi:hypothetical protein